MWEEISEGGGRLPYMYLRPQWRAGD
jgi:hypothetical protein